MRNYKIVLLTDNKTEIFYTDFNFWCNISWCITVRVYVYSFVCDCLK
jgi:hypothetical protein